MLATGLYSVGKSARSLIGSGSSTVPAAGLYKGQNSPLYIVDTAGKAVEVGYSAAGRAATVESGSAAGRAAIVDQPQQGSKVSFQL